MKRLKRWIRHEPGLKIISFILAVILWFYITGEITERTDLETRLFDNILVTIIGQSESFGTSIKIDPRVVDLEIGAPANTISLLRYDEIKAYVKVEGLSLGKYDLVLQVDLPEEAVLVSKEPLIKVEIGILDKDEDE